MREGMEEVFEDWVHRNAVDVFSVACFYNPSAAQLLQGLHWFFPVGPDETLLRGTDVVFQQFENRVERFLAAGQTEFGILEGNPDAHGTVWSFVTQRKEHVTLSTVPDQESSDWLFLQLVMRFLYRHGTPVEATLL